MALSGLVDVLFTGLLGSESNQNEQNEDGVMLLLRDASFAPTSRGNSPRYCSPLSMLENLSFSFINQGTALEISSFDRMAPILYVPVMHYLPLSTMISTPGNLASISYDNHPPQDVTWSHRAAEHLHVLPNRWRKLCHP